MRPPLLDDFGLAAAAQHHANLLPRPKDLAVQVDVRDDELLSLPQANPLFRILQEAATHVLRHAEAKTLRIVGAPEGDNDLLEVIDDGRGLGEVRADASGLRNIRERVLLVDEHPIMRVGVRQLILQEWPAAQIDEAPTLAQVSGGLASAGTSGNTSQVIANVVSACTGTGSAQSLTICGRLPALAQEGTCPMVLREVPGLRLADVGNASSSVRLLVGLRQAANGERAASASNAGNVHMKIEELRLLGAGTEGLVIEQKGPQSMIFPGEERSFKLPRVASAEAKGLSLQVTTDQGQQHVAFNVQP